MAFDPPRDQVRALFPTLPFPESDWAPLLFFAAESGKPLTEVWETRTKAGSWEAARAKLGVSADKVLVDLDSDTKPPFDRARSTKASAPNDADIFRCVNLRALAKGLALPIETIAARRAAGMTWKAIAAERWRESEPR